MPAHNYKNKIWLVDSFSYINLIERLIGGKSKNKGWLKGTSKPVNCGLDWEQTEQSVCWLAGLTACSKHRIGHVLHGVRIMKGVETSTLAIYTLKKVTAHSQNFWEKVIHHQIVNSSTVGERSIRAQMRSKLHYIHVWCLISEKGMISEACGGRESLLQSATLPRHRKIIGCTLVTVALGYYFPPPY